MSTIDSSDNKLIEFVERLENYMEKKLDKATDEELKKAINYLLGRKKWSS